MIEERRGEDREEEKGKGKMGQGEREAEKGKETVSPRKSEFKKNILFLFVVELRLVGSLKVCLHDLLSNVTQEGLLSIGVPWVAKITLKDQKQEMEHFLFVASKTCWCSSWRRHLLGRGGGV